MATWTSQLTATSGDYTPIIQTITSDDGECLQSIYDTLESHATSTGNTLTDYVQQSICVGLENDETIVNTPSIATLKATGVIVTNDNVHIGLTTLGYGFMEVMLAE
jgi:hypothetical protein